MPTRTEVFQEIDQLLVSMKDLLVKKDKLYSGDKIPFVPIRASEEIGIPAHISCFIRMIDKFNRMKQLVNPANSATLEVERRSSESLEDTALDLANYSLIFIHLLRAHRASLSHAPIVDILEREFPQEVPTLVPVNNSDKVV